MYVREKLIGLLKEATFDSVEKCRAYEECESCPNNGVGISCSVPFEVDYLISKGVTVQEWISVKDRLPEVGSRVIACGEKGGVFLVKAEGETTGFGRMDGGSKYRSFTHWMPLPQPPKGEKQCPIN